MVCKCRDGTYGNHCCKRSRGRRNTSRSHNSQRSASPTEYSRLGGSAYRQMNKGGKLLQQIGFAQYANAHLSMPSSSGKIWTTIERRQAFDVRSSHYGYAADMRKNPSKYDFRPPPEWKANLAYKDTWRGKDRPLKGREAHWHRRPVHVYGPNAKQSQLSRPTYSEIHHHRKSQKRKGISKFGLGTSMRFLGTGLLIFQLGTYAKWIHDDWTTAAPKIIEDLTFAKWLGPLAEGAQEHDNLNWNSIIPNLGTIG